MQKLILFISLILSTSIIFSQNKPAYKLFDKKGKTVSYQKMIKEFSKADIVLFGEYHNNPIVHWLQFEVTYDLHKKRDLILGAEMFEADNQQVLNSYLSGEIDAKALDTLARLWNNYKTDYKPLVDFAKSNQLKFIATNIPRKFANLVYKKGFKALDTLSFNEKKWMASLPISYDANLPGYVKMKAMMGGHGGDNLPKAQAIKDATMAHFIFKNLNNNKLFIHYNGAYHSDDFEGIYWYLKLKKTALKIVTVSVVEQKNVKKLSDENKLKANFIVVVSDTMTKTY